MKKIAIAITIMLAFSAFAMAGDIVISGSATTTMGYNLDDSTYGILSEAASDATIVLGAADGESAGDGEWYGVISLTGGSIGTGSTALEVYANDGDGDVDDVVVVSSTAATAEADYVTMPFAITVPTVAAKITNGNLYGMLQSEATFGADFVAAVEEDDVKSFTEIDSAGSLTFGGVFAPATVAVEVGTEGNYDGAAGTGLAYGVDVALDVAPLAVSLAFDGTNGYASADVMGMAAKVVADVAPLAITAAFDVDAFDVFSYEAGLGVDVDLAPLTVGIDAYYAEDNVDTALALGYADDAMGVKVTVGAYNLTAPVVDWSAALDLTFAVNSGVALKAGFSTGSDDVMAAYANVALTELIDNVTFTAGWEEGNDLTKVAADGVEEMGRIVFATKMAY